MRTLFFCVVAVVGCSDGTRQQRTGSDAAVDMCAQPAPPADLAESPPDLAEAIVDMAHPCPMPGVGFYFETMAYSFSPAAGGAPQATLSQGVVFVDQNRVVTRPPPAQFSPSTWRCEDIQPSTTTCQAPCCAGEASAVPILQYTGGDLQAGTRAGWRLIRTGRCRFVDPATSLVWFADVSGVYGSPQ